MKVLHIYRTYFPDPPGGLQEAIRQISLATRARGADPRIFALSPDPVPRDVALPEGIVTRSRSWAAPASCDLGGLDALLRYRELASSADLLHFHFPWPFADVLHLLGRVDRPALMTWHSDVVRQRALGAIYGPLMRTTLRSMSAVVATSDTYARTSAVLGRVVAPARLRTIPLGIGDYRDDPVEGRGAPGYLRRLMPEGGAFILAIGVLRYYKGLHTLIECASAIGAKIVIAGDGPERANLAALAGRMGVSNVIFAGRVSHDEKVELLKGCTALVLPSHLRSEAFGMVLVEAAMFGKPMVCCEIGSGTSFVNEHGVTGLVVPPESPREFAAAVNALVGDAALAQRMGTAARARYERLFSGPALGAAYCALYAELLAARGRAPATFPA